MQMQGVPKYPQNKDCGLLVMLMEMVQQVEILWQQKRFCLQETIQVMVGCLALEVVEWWQLLGGLLAS